MDNVKLGVMHIEGKVVYEIVPMDPEGQKILLRIPPEMAYEVAMRSTKAAMAAEDWLKENRA